MRVKVNWKELGLWSAALVIPGGLLAIGLWHLVQYNHARQSAEQEEIEKYIHQISGCHMCQACLLAGAAKWLNNHLVVNHQMSDKLATKAVDKAFTRFDRIRKEKSCSAK